MLPLKTSFCLACLKYHAPVETLKPGELQMHTIVEVGFRLAVRFQ